MRKKTKEVIVKLIEGQISTAGERYTWPLRWPPSRIEKKIISLIEEKTDKLDKRLDVVEALTNANAYKWDAKRKLIKVVPDDWEEESSEEALDGTDGKE